MLREIFIVFILVFSTGVSGLDLQTAFKAIDQSRKGPFSLNYQQGTESRTVTGQGWPKGEHLFQAAFREDQFARALANEESFYVGNLFTTNYFELMGEYVFGDAYGSHPLDHNALLAQSPAARAKAMTMVRHWVLEKHYIQHFPLSGLARGFRTWGVSDTANEIEYARYFFDFYLSAIKTKDEFAILPAMLLLKASPVGESPSIERARILVAEAYDYFATRFAAQDPRLNRMREIRNAVHNQMSPEIVGMIDQYDRDFPYYRKEGHTNLFKVREILLVYYAVGPKVVLTAAKELDDSKLIAAAQDLIDAGPRLEQLLNLSEQGAQLRLHLPSVPYFKKTDALKALAVIAQYLNKEVTALSTIESPAVLKVIVNTVYMEGFLITDNWKLYVEELADLKTAKAGVGLLAEVSEIGQLTLGQAFEPALDQWLLLEPKMQYFVDNSIKASALNTAAITAEKLTHKGL